jgi:phosphate transport system protein
MSRIELDRQLAELRTAVLQMGESVVDAVGQAMEALTHPAGGESFRYDHRAVDAVIAGDDTIDRECAAIEDLSARVITLQQPAVRDLRAVLAALIIAEELERIGDHAEGIGHLTTRLLQPPDSQEVQTLTNLAALARVQLQGALDAYRAGDATRAREVWAGDDAMDSLHSQFVQALLSRMRNDQDKVVNDTYLLWVSHNLERIADRATNICERVVYIATGERITEPLA